MLRNKIVLTAAAFVAGVAITLATFGPAANAVVANQEDHAYLAAQKAQVIGTTFQIDNSGFHELDVRAAAGEIVPGALGAVRRARIATQATEWPEGLQPMATELVSHMTALEEAIRTEDPAIVAEPAKLVHDVGHDLSAAVYTWLETGQVPEAGEGHGH